MIFRGQPNFSGEARKLEFEGEEDIPILFRDHKKLMEDKECREDILDFLHGSIIMGGPHLLAAMGQETKAYQLAQLIKIYIDPATVSASKVQIHFT